MQKKYSKIGVLIGGVSSEREISLRSGRAVVRGLEQAGYAVDPIDVKASDFRIPTGLDAVFIALHGTFGEDGGVQQRLSELKIPYSGSDPEASRIAFDKLLTRRRLEEADIPIPEGYVLRRDSPRPIAPPLVVKPPRQGSSIGCHIVFNADEWEESFQDALSYSEQVIVERYIPGRELTIGMLNGELLPPVEIKPASDYYDFNAKYISQTTHYICPATLDRELAKRANEIALETIATLNCRGLGRVDMRLAPDGKLYVLELNTIPGFTETSLLPKAAKAAGIEFPELCQRIVECATTA